MTPCVEVAYHWHPAVGYCVALLGVVGVLVPWLMGEKMGTKQKVLWATVMIVLTGFELWAIKGDGKERDAEQAFTRCEEQNRFEGIVNNLNKGIAVSKTQYDSTITHVDGVLKTTQTVASLAKENLEDVTGGDTYAYVVPEVFGVNDKKELPFHIYSKGKNILTGVSVRFIDLNNNFATADHVQEIRSWPTEEVGTLHPGEGKLLKTAFVPQMNLRNPTGGDPWYQITIYSQNFTVYEKLELRQGKYLPWEYSFGLSQMKVIPCSKGLQPSGPNNECKKQTWFYDRPYDTDEGKPIAPHP